MKIGLITDMEGVCGVVNYHDWATPQGKYYDNGKMLLTMEVNAAVEGFFEEGATAILVIDGHGSGGVNNEHLDERVHYLRGPTPGPYPFMIDESFDALAWVGQHAKAGTECAHMAHTGSFDVIDYKINNLSIGEFGQIALCGAEFGVRSIFGSGGEAFTKEASRLIEGVETVSVKCGIMPGKGDECNVSEYIHRNNGAIHLHPKEAREKIKAGAKRALNRFMQDKEQFELLKIKPPFIKEVSYRDTDTKKAHSKKTEHSDIISLLNSGL